MSTTLSGDQGAQLTGDARAEYVRSMFARIVPRYDLFNTLSTLGQDVLWRRMVVKQAALPQGGRALDVATGTGGVAFALAQRTPSAHVEGLDFCEPMVLAARVKAESWEGSGPAPTFVVGDVLTLPYDDESFDCVTISFGIRNVADIPRALAEIRRVLRPGGRFICLELTPVQSPLIRVPIQFYLYKCAPLLGRLLSGDRAAYEYLPHSVAHFPNANTLARMLQAAGLRNVRYRLLNFGSIAIHRGVR